LQEGLLKQNPAISFSRIDGRVRPEDRVEIAETFNNDCTIDVLLLTTKVGGLGLNLTGADTVIFFDHDWNPTNDMQAMDRAHRIGQKRRVMVYRLIVTNSIEEEVMNLQKFKKDVASAVVSTENSSVSTLGSHKLVDLLEGSVEAPRKKRQKTVENQGEESMSRQGAVGGKVANLLRELDDISEEEKRYEEEFSREKFMARMKK